MPRQDYHKLVRDRIPDILQDYDIPHEIVTMDEASYAEALRRKLVEEAQEAAAADADLVTELADLFEVIDALLTLHGIDRQTVLTQQTQRRDERGAFHQRWLLRWTEVH
ncbi:MAG: nucleotide pyrophosphohydrolase [Leptolyngbya sp. DLM2.Bin15]|nr:MAG: nucleotide pyrophosphohydrolase [Leptolyngbya sp. DLM2.Bin15]